MSCTFRSESKAAAFLPAPFVAAPQPLYSHYANLVRHPGALSALTDQSIAGGVMNLIGSTLLYGALVITWRSGGAARRNVGAAMRRLPSARG